VVVVVVVVVTVFVAVVIVVLDDVVVVGDVIVCSFVVVAVLVVVVGFATVVVLTLTDLLVTVGVVEEPPAVAIRRIATTAAIATATPATIANWRPFRPPPGPDRGPSAPRGWPVRAEASGSGDPSGGGWSPGGGVSLSFIIRYSRAGHHRARPPGRHRPHRVKG
jgi:hypothetical protein